MAYVYRYTDKADGIIKYVGIVWGKTRTLSQRIREHSTEDEWCKDKEWKIEYIEENINSRTDAEYMEAHLISLYGTDKYYNVSKAGWGISNFIPARNDWKCIEETPLPLTREDITIRSLRKQLNECIDRIRELKREVAVLERALDEEQRNIKKVYVNVPSTYMASPNNPVQSVSKKARFNWFDISRIYERFPECNLHFYSTVQLDDGSIFRDIRIYFTGEYIVVKDVNSISKLTFDEAFPNLNMSLKIDGVGGCACDNEELMFMLKDEIDKRSLI